MPVSYTHLDVYKRQAVLIGLATLAVHLDKLHTGRRAFSFFFRHNGRADNCMRTDIRALVALLSLIHISQARQRLDAQKPDVWYTAHADYTIENTGTLEALQRQVDMVMNGILKPEDS